MADGRRAVILVANPAAPYSRSLRIARSLRDEGFEVEIAASAGDRHPDLELDGAIVTRRYRPSGMFARFADSAPRPASLAGRLLERFLTVAAWPFRVRGWWATLRRELPAADLYHACGILTLPIALDLAADAKRRGRAGRVIYDVIDIILESNNYARVPRPILATYQAREFRWARKVDAVVTVNEPIADHLVLRWKLEARPTVLLNCQPRWSPPARHPDLIRHELQLPASDRIVVFLGRLGRERGLDETAEAILSVDHAVLVLIGFGPWVDDLRRRGRDPRYRGRLYILPPVHPDDVVPWTASADVSVIAVPANSLNQRLSTPNKFWESIAAGTPMIVGRDLQEMCRILLSERLGEVADPSDPNDISLAIRSLLDRPIEEREEIRARSIRVAQERYNWELAVRPYLDLVQDVLSS